MRCRSVGGFMLIAALMTGTVLTAAGCSSRDDDGGDDSSAVSDDRPAGGEAIGDAPESAAGDGVANPVASSVPTDVIADDREVVYTATLAVAVADVRAVAAQVRTIAASGGGRLQDERSSGSGETATSTLVLKVPPERFSATLDEIAALGEERDRIVAAEDVTAEGVDLDARIRSATASVERTRALLAQAKEIGEIVVVEAELAERESALEQLQGQRRVLDASVALATITVSLEHDTEPLVVADDDEADGWPGPLDALATGGRSVLTVLNVLVIGLALALPWTPVLAAAGGAAWWYRRRRSGPAVHQDPAT